MDIAIDDLSVEHNVAARRFEIHHGDEMARLEYHLRGPSIVYTHTIVPVVLDGHGTLMDDCTPVSAKLPSSRTSAMR